MPVGRMQLPCWTCERPQALDARAWLANCSDEDLEKRVSPSGLPLNCCRIRTVWNGAGGAGGYEVISIGATPVTCCASHLPNLPPSLRQVCAPVVGMSLLLRTLRSR